MVGSILIGIGIGTAEPDDPPEEWGDKQAKPLLTDLISRYADDNEGEKVEGMTRSVPLVCKNPTSWSTFSRVWSYTNKSSSA